MYGQPSRKRRCTYDCESVFFNSDTCTFSGEATTGAFDELESHRSENHQGWAPFVPWMLRTWFQCQLTHWTVALLGIAIFLLKYANIFLFSLHRNPQIPLSHTQSAPSSLIRPRRESHTHSHAQLCALNCTTTTASHFLPSSSSGSYAQPAAYFTELNDRFIPNHTRKPRRDTGTRGRTCEHSALH